jgi:hypothetical protein
MGLFKSFAVVVGMMGVHVGIATDFFLHAKKDRMEMTEKNMLELWYVQRGGRLVTDFCYHKKKKERSAIASPQPSSGPSLSHTSRTPSPP